ncbi:MAG: hypothetical protein WCO55_03000 [Candidatus Falkowbacteria bacterium]
MIFFGKKTAKPEFTPEELTTKKKQLIDSEVEEYIGSSGVSTKWLEYGVWYQQHRRLFTLTVVWFLAIAASIFWAFVLYYIASFLYIGIRQDQENSVALSTYSLRPQRSDQSANLEYTFFQALALPNGRYDLVGKVTNKSTNGWASFNYNFSDGQQSLGAGTGFVYPGETKYLLALGQSLKGSPFDVRLIMSNILLNRFTPRNMTDWSGYHDAHLDFIIQDKVYMPADESGLTEKLPINRVSFSIINNSAYTYRTVPFLIILYYGDKMVAVDRYIANNFKPKEKIDADLSFVGSLGPVSRLDIVPDVNILDTANFGSVQ